MNKFSPFCAAVNRGSKPIRIVSHACHEGFQVSLAQTNTEWAFIPSPEGKTWDNDYRSIPSNIIEISEEQFNKMSHVDLAMSHTVQQIKGLENMSNFFKIKHINLNHIYPNPSFNSRYIKMINNLRENAIKVFTTEHQANEWGYDKSECKIINHGVDCNHFKDWNPVSNKVLTVGNFYSERGEELGYDTYLELKQKINPEAFVHVGKSNDNSSLPAKDYNQLAEIYRSCYIFLNTCHRSVLPTVMVEAMATGMPVITKENPTIKRIIKHGVNGFIANTANEMAEYISLLNNDRELAKKIGDEARKTALEKYNMDRFTREWNTLFKELIAK